MNRKPGKKSRRIFIRNLALMGGAAPLLASTVKAMGLGFKKNTKEIPDQHPSQGYRLTPHIQKYYKKIGS